MATSSGAPPAQTTTKEPLTAERKRLFGGLAVVGVLALLVGGRFVLGGSGGDATPIPTAAPVAPTTPQEGAPNEGGPAPDQGGAPNMANGGLPPSGAAQTVANTGAGNPASLLPLANYRPDPFQPFVRVPDPTPIPPPAPTPTPTPIPLPPPIPLPAPDSGFPGSGFPGSGPTNLPGGVPNSGGARAISSGPLPSIVIPRLNGGSSRPVDAFPPPRSSSAGGGSNVVSPSFGKRLSGIVIGNGVRAVLEISNGQTVKSYVVQPGDVVEGITVLNIQRFNESGTQVTRMLIRENGAERSVDLKPGPPRTDAGAGGGPGFGGTP